MSETESIQDDNLQEIRSECEEQQNQRLPAPKARYRKPFLRTGSGATVPEPKARYRGLKDNKELKKIEELCFAGAANRGICYLGVLKYLDDHNLLDLKKFVGVSIGSLVGVCYIFGFEPSELFELILLKDLSDFEDISFKSVINNGSVLDGNNYRMWVWDLISKKTDPMIDFEKIKLKYGVEIIITATCLDLGEDGLSIFSYTHTPKMPIYYAIIASMTIPFVFPPLVYNNKRYVDGGVLENFPMYLLSKDAVGFRVTSKPIEADVTNMSYFFKIIQLMTNYMRNIKEFEGKEYVIDALDYSIIDFSMTLDNKITLYYRGYKTAENVLNL